MNMVTSTPAAVDWTATLTGEMLLFGLLGKLLYTYPEKDWLQPLVDEEVFTESPFAVRQPDVVAGLTLLENWSQACRNGISVEAWDDLKVDNTRLFVGAGTVLAPPWESVYFDEERRTFQEQTLQVREWYRGFGLASVKLNSEPDDHVGLELAFLAHLAGLGLAALEKQDEAKFEESLEAQQEFLSKHVLKWVPAWCNLVEEHAHTDFYRGIARMTRGALAEIAVILDVEVPAEI